MKKRAIIFNGQLRTSKKLIENISSNLLDENVDVFCHFWDYNKDINENKVLDSITRENAKKYDETYKELVKGYNGVMAGIYYKLDKNLLSFFIEKIKPKKYLIEEQIYFYNDNNDEEDDNGLESNDLIYFRRKSSLYSIIQCLNMVKEYEVKNNFTYENIFITRPNVNFIKPMQSKLNNTNIDVFNIYANFSERWMLDYNLLSKTDTFLKFFLYMFDNMNIISNSRYNNKIPEKFFYLSCKDLNIKMINFKVKEYTHGYRFGYVYPYQYDEYNLM